jgi:SHS2 domain-containing protein
MAETPRRWRPSDRADAYQELEHPADLYLEIRGRDLPELVEHALFALYDHIADLARFEARGDLVLRVSEPSLDEALRSLLSEALYHVDSDGFVATAGEVQVERAEASPAGEGRTAAGQLVGDGWILMARLRGENADRAHRPLLTEIKAVTYHHLEVKQGPGGDWRARVLLDV